MIEGEIERNRWQVFVLRVFTSKAGNIVGHVEHARTGEKRLFRGLEELGRAISGWNDSRGVIHDAPGAAEEE